MTKRDKTKSPEKKAKKGKLVRLELTSNGGHGLPVANGHADLAPPLPALEGTRDGTRDPHPAHPLAFVPANGDAAPLPSFHDRQRALKNSYREEPALARQVSAVHSVTPPDADTGKVRIAIENAAGISVDIGAHHSVGGVEDVGCSGDYFLASLAGCYEVTFRLVAAASKITLNRFALRIEGDWDARGTLGLDRNVPVGFTSLRVVIDFDADGPAERIARLGELTERYCVVTQTLKHPPAIHVRHRGVLLPRFG